jgi:hypothetical protein
VSDLLSAGILVCAQTLLSQWVMVSHWRSPKLITFPFCFIIFLVNVLNVISGDLDTPCPQIYFPVFIFIFKMIKMIWVFLWLKNKKLYCEKISILFLLLTIITRGTKNFYGVRILKAKILMLLYNSLNQSRCYLSIILAGTRPAPLHPSYKKKGGGASRWFIHFIGNFKCTTPPSSRETS